MFLVPRRLRTKLLYWIYTQLNDMALVCYDRYWEFLYEENPDIRIK